MKCNLLSRCKEHAGFPPTHLVYWQNLRLKQRQTIGTKQRQGQRKIQELSQSKLNRQGAHALMDQLQAKVRPSKEHATPLEQDPSQREQVFHRNWRLHCLGQTS